MEARITGKVDGGGDRRRTRATPWLPGLVSFMEASTEYRHLKPNVYWYRGSWRLRRQPASLRGEPMLTADEGIVLVAGMRTGRLAAMNVSFAELDLLTSHPVLFEVALAAGIGFMVKDCSHGDLLLAPPAQTRAFAEVFGRQLAGRAWRPSARGRQEVPARRRFGGKRVLVGKELGGSAVISWVGVDGDLNRDSESWCLADSIADVRALDHVGGVSRGGPPRPLIMQVGYAGGVRTCDEAVEFARTGISAGKLRVIGALGVEGTIGCGVEATTLESVHRFVRALGAGGDTLRAHGVLTTVLGGVPEPDRWYCSRGTDAFSPLSALSQLHRLLLRVIEVLVPRAGSYATVDQQLQAQGVALCREAPQLTKRRCLAGNCRGVPSRGERLFSRWPTLESVIHRMKLIAASSVGYEGAATRTHTGPLMAWG